MDPSDLVLIGRTGVSVSRLGVGLAPMIGHAGPVTDRTADAIVRRAHLLGLRYVDVAPLYGVGRGEAVLRRDFERSGDAAMTVSTKAGRLLRPRTPRNRVVLRARELRYTDQRGELVRGYLRVVRGRLLEPASPPPGELTSEPVDRPTTVALRDYTSEGIQTSARESLQRLGRDRVPILFLHDPDGLRGAALRAAWEPLRELRASGIAGAIGISGNVSRSLTTMLRELDPDVVMIAGRYTLMDQCAMVDLLPIALERGVSVVLGGIFNGGLLADPDHVDQFDYRPARTAERRRAARIARLARTFDVPLVAAAIQFAAAHPAVASVLVGVRSEDELADDVELAQVPIPATFWEAMVEEGLLHPWAPRPPDETDLEEAAG